jgi:hypothetical protein
MRKTKFATLASFLGLAVLVSLGITQEALAAPHTPGKNVSHNGTVYMITDDGQRRPYTSAGAFVSYGFNYWQFVEPASQEDLAMPVSSFIPPRDGKIVCSDRGSDKGTCYLITNGKRAGFVSEKVFKDLGFSFSKALYGDVSFMDKDTNISEANSQHRAGVLINKNGTLYIVSPTGLLGVPDFPILNTWGYALDEAVPANGADNTLSQASTITYRAGAKLAPYTQSAGPALPSSPATEEDLLKSYIDTHPELPTNEISSPTEGAAVLALARSVIAANSFSETYPYLSAKTLEMINRLPSFAKVLSESDGVELSATSELSSKISLYEGNVHAMVTYTEKQEYTNYTNTYYFVFVKEAGVWKFDLIGSIKYQIKVDRLKNPYDAYITGSGTTDLGIETFSYPDNPKINNPQTKLYVEVKNYGQTTIHKYALVLEFNTVEVYADTRNEELKPGQSVVIEIPLTTYWNLPTTTKAPGTYRTEVWVGIDPSGLDANSNNNGYYSEDQFYQ